MKYIIDIKGEIEGDYEIIGKYEERPMGERKRGKWKTFKNSCTIQCNQCLTKMTSLCDITLPNFCPNCGADMRGEQE